MSGYTYRYTTTSHLDYCAGSLKSNALIEITRNVVTLLADELHICMLHVLVVKRRIIYFLSRAIYRCIVA